MAKQYYTMENLTNDLTNKYQVTLQFDMDEAFMTLVHPHRLYINSLIEKNIIDSYTVSLETHRSWMVINAANKNDVKKYLRKSPLFKYWIIEIDELFVFDGQNYRLPAFQLN
jgi:hypothetical protein